MSACRCVLAQFGGKITFLDLHVIAIHLHLNIGHAHGSADRICIRLQIQKVPRHVSSVQGFDEYGHAFCRTLLSGVTQVFDEGLETHMSVDCHGCNSCHHMHFAGPELDCVRNCHVDAALKVELATRHASHSPFTRGPIAGGTIEHGTFKLRLAKELPEYCRRLVVWKQELDTPE